VAQLVDRLAQHLIGPRDRLVGIGEQNRTADVCSAVAELPGGWFESGFVSGAPDPVRKVRRRGHRPRCSRLGAAL
jgi:hypothetical protein